MQSEVRITLPLATTTDFNPNEPNGEKLGIWTSADFVPELTESLRAQFATPLTGKTWCRHAAVAGTELFITARTPANLHTDRHGYVTIWISRRAAGELLGALTC